MARTKNRGYQQTLAPTYTARLWKMGGYIRLSREDLQKINRGLDDSNSVKRRKSACGKSRKKGSWHSLLQKNAGCRIRF